MRKIFSIVLVFALMFSLPMTVFADYASEMPGGINEIYEEYLNLVDEGILGEDVTYEYWCELIEVQKQLEDSLEESDDFRIVAEFNGNTNCFPKLFSF